MRLISELMDAEGLLRVAVSRIELADDLEKNLKTRLKKVAADIELIMKEEESAGVGGTPFYALEDDDEEEQAPRPKRNKTPDKKKEKPEQKPKKKYPPFSLNDRFLFVRELFGGDASEFNAAVEAAISAPDYQKAEELLVRAYSLNPDESPASNFLAIIAKSFG